MADAPKLSRPKLITALAVMQFLYAAFYLAGAVIITFFQIVFFDLTHDERDFTSSIQGITIAALASLVLIIMMYVSANGLWTMKPRSRWLALCANGTIVVILMYINFDDWLRHSLYLKNIWVPITFMLPVIPFLLPVVGRTLNTNLKS